MLLHLIICNNGNALRQSIKRKMMTKNRKGTKKTKRTKRNNRNQAINREKKTHVNELPQTDRKLTPTFTKYVFVWRHGSFVCVANDIAAS